MDRLITIDQYIAFAPSITFQEIHYIGPRPCIATHSLHFIHSVQFYLHVTVKIIATDGRSPSNTQVCACTSLSLFMFIYIYIYIYIYIGVRDHEEDVDAGVELDGGAEGAGVVADPEGELVGVCCSIYIYIYIYNITRVYVVGVYVSARVIIFYECQARLLRMRSAAEPGR